MFTEVKCKIKPVNHAVILIYTIYKINMKERFTLTFKFIDHFKHSVVAQNVEKTVSEHIVKDTYNF